MFRTLMWVYLPNRRACHSSKYCGSLENSPAIVQQTRNQVSRIASIRSINVATSRLVMKVGKAVCLADLRINVKVVFCFALSSWLLRWLDTCVTICSIAELSQQGVQIFVAVVVELLSLRHKRFPLARRSFSDFCRPLLAGDAWHLQSVFHLSAWRSLRSCGFRF